MEKRSVEFAIWRWVTLVVVLVSAFLIASSQRWYMDRAGNSCVALDRWSGYVYPCADRMGSTP